jgi:hypothetical protein
VPLIPESDHPFLISMQERNHPESRTKIKRKFEGCKEVDAVFK